MINSSNYKDMNRRRFIEKSSVLAATTLLPLSACTTSKMNKYKMGYQLFSIREDMAKDPVATLTAAKAMGYQDFEVYGFEPEAGTFYGFTSAEFKTVLDDLDITATSGHFGFSPYLDKSDDELKEFVDRCIKGARTLGMKYITWPWIAPEQRSLDNFKIMADKLNLIGEQVVDSGLGFAYHNHGFEFTDHDGQTGYEIILAETDPSLVKLQMDMYWVMHSSSYTPKQLVEQQPGRFVMWHIKDMDKVTRDYTELGNGSIDYVDILPDPAASGLEFYYLEQGGNFAHSAMKSAADSAAYFQKHLQPLI